MRLRDDRAVDARQTTEVGLGERPDLADRAVASPVRPGPVTAHPRPARIDPARAESARVDPNDRAAAVSAGAVAGAALGVLTTLAVIWVRRRHR